MHLLPFLSQKRLYNHKCLSVRPSVCPSVCHRIPSASQNQAYLPLLLCINLSDTYQQSCHAAIIPISHSPPPHISCQSAIIPISHNDPSAIMPPWHCCHYIYQLTDLLLRLLSHFGLFQIIK